MSETALNKIKDLCKKVMHERVLGKSAYSSAEDRWEDQTFIDGKQNVASNILKILRGE
jgi:hypothetical protein